MKFVAFACSAFALANVAGAQPNPLLPTKEALQLYNRVVQLIESTSIAVPDLKSAAVPLIQNTRQSLQTLEKATTQQHAGLTWNLLTSVRAYLTLADSVPKPFPFPDQARKQFVELRESVDRMESHFRALLDQKETVSVTPDRDNLKRYAEANERLGPPSPDVPRAVFLGDSITDGWRLNEYFTGRDFVNRGIGGQVTGEMLARMKADVINLQPKAMLVLGGTNDIARGIPSGTIENNLTMIADLAVAHHIQPLFASLLPVSDYHKNQNPQYERSIQRPPAMIIYMNNWLKEFCKQRNFVYVDYYSRMIDQAGLLRTDLADDGLHPNAAGYRIMAPIALEAIGSVISEPKSAPQRKKKKRLGLT